MLGNQPEVQWIVALPNAAVAPDARFTPPPQSCVSWDEGKREGMIVHSKEGLFSGRRLGNYHDVALTSGYRSQREW